MSCRSGGFNRFRFRAERLNSLLRIVASLAVALQPAAPAGAQMAQARLTVIGTNANSVVLALDAPQPALRTVMVDGRSYTAIEMAGALPDTRNGEAQTPVIGALLAVPPAGTVTLEVISLEAVPLSIGAPLLMQPAPTPAPGEVDFLPPPINGTPSVQAQPAAELVDTTWWRSQRVARVRLRPVRQEGEALLFHRRIVVRVRFTPGGSPTDAASADHAAAAPAHEGAFEPFLRAALLNYDQGLAWRAAGGAAEDLPSLVAIAADDAPWWRVTLAAPGMVRLDCTMLAAAGVSMTAGALQRVSVYDQGKGRRALAVQVIDNGDTACDTSDAVVFYAPPAPSAYAAHLVVWLTVAADFASVYRATAQEASVAPGALETDALTTIRHEANRLYYSYVPLEEGAEHWYWDLLAPATGAARSYPFTLTATSVLTAPLQTVLEVAGYDGAHVTQLMVNGTTVATETWSGRTRRTITTTVAPELLQAGGNVLRVTAAGSGDLQYVDAFTISGRQRLMAERDRLAFSQPAAGAHAYAVSNFTTADVAIYDISEHSALRVMATTLSAPCPCTASFADDAPAPRHYVALSAAQMNRPLRIEAAPASGLRGDTPQVDYLILAPGGLLAAVTPLAQYRAAQGLAVRSVDLQAVYDEFGDGRPHPEAIRALIAHALAAWQRPAPTYVLLVGDGTYDPLGYLSTPPALSTPAYLRTVDPRLGETASDNRLASAWDSPLPQVMIGRLPATTPDEVTAMVAKITAFEAAPADDPWRQRATLVADNAYSATGAPDPGGNFWQKADAAAALLGSQGVAAERLYYNPCDPSMVPACALPYQSFAEAPSLTAALATAWQAGRRFVIFTGHGSPTSWAGAPALLTADTVATLNSAAPPVVLEMSCYTGFFHFPLRPALAETLVRQVGGAVATWSSSGQSVARGHDLLLADFLGAALAGPAPTLGAAILTAKSNLFATGAGIYDDLIDTFHLFGDPALRLSPPRPPASATPAATPGATVPAPTLPAPSASPATTPRATPSPTPQIGSDVPWPSPVPSAPPMSTPQPAGASLFLPVVEHAADMP